MTTPARLTPERPTHITAYPRTIRPDHSRSLLRILIFGFRLQAYSRLAINWVRA